MVDSRFFKQSRFFTLKEVVKITGGKLLNTSSQLLNLNTYIKDVSPLNKATVDHVAFINNVKYMSQLQLSKAGVCILDPAYKRFAPKTMTLILSSKPYRAYAAVAQAFYPNISIEDLSIQKPSYVDPSAVISKNVILGANVIINKGVFVGEDTIIRAGSVIGFNVRVGNKCDIGEGCVISHSLLGDNIFIAPGVKIGQPGFGFDIDELGHINIPQLGRVIIGNNVEIGANTTIDRGTSSDTIIGEGSRIDNLVQLGHNVRLGKKCVVVAQVGIAGSTCIGDFTMIGGQVGIAGHLIIGKKVRIAAKSGVTRNIKELETVAGFPSVSINAWHRQNIILSKLSRKSTLRKSL